MIQLHSEYISKLKILNDDLVDYIEIEDVWGDESCIFKEKFEDFNFERCNHIFTPEMESIMLASKVLRKNKNKKEVKNDLLSKMAPPDGLDQNHFQHVEQLTPI